MNEEKIGPTSKEGEVCPSEAETSIKNMNNNNNEQKQADLNDRPMKSKKITIMF